MSDRCIRRLGGCALALTALVSTATFAKAKAHQQARRATWEYCAITRSFGTNTAKGTAIGVVTVVYFEEAGPRQEVVRVEGEALDPAVMVNSEPFEKARLVALSKTIAQLGASGWELVGELPYAQRSSSDAEAKALYFKRQRDEAMVAQGAAT